jgi:hypothetical protein
MPEIWFPGAEMQSAYSRQAHGAVIIDGKEVGTTLQCPHCNGHFLSVRGSGHRRTFCARCNAITCGSRACDPCRPFEEQMEAIERAATREMRLGI